MTFEGENLTKGNVLYHTNGRYSIVVYDTFADSAGREWVLYLIVQNCDNTFEAFQNAYIEQDLQDEGTRILKNSFFESNFIHCASLERLSKRFTRTAMEIRGVEAFKVKEHTVHVSEEPEEDASLFERVVDLSIPEAPTTIV